VRLKGIVFENVEWNLPYVTDCCERIIESSVEKVRD
jgi:hypothetical protein